MMNDLLKTRLHSLLTLNKVTSAEHDFWVARLANVPREVFEQVLSKLEDRPGEAGWLYTIQRKREIAIAEGARSAWEGVIEKEHAQLLSYLNK